MKITLDSEVLSAFVHSSRIKQYNLRSEHDLVGAEALWALNRLVAGIAAHAENENPGFDSEKFEEDCGF